jgi:hypothetical protein
MLVICPIFNGKLVLHPIPLIAALGKNSALRKRV